MFEPNIEITQVLEVFICPFCRNYLSRPIGQCVQGHCFCYGCFQIIDECSVCQGEKSVVRPRALERLQSEMLFLCKHRDQGCNYIGGNGNELKAHEKTCLGGFYHTQRYGNEGKAHEQTSEAPNAKRRFAGYDYTEENGNEPEAHEETCGEPTAKRRKI